MLCTRFIRHISQLLLPHHCLLCHFPTRQAYPICNACQDELPILPHHCRKCAQIIPSNPPPPKIKQKPPQTKKKFSVLAPPPPPPPPENTANSPKNFFLFCRLEGIIC